MGTNNQSLTGFEACSTGGSSCLLLKSSQKTMAEVLGPREKLNVDVKQVFKMGFCSNKGIDLMNMPRYDKIE